MAPRCVLIPEVAASMAAFGLQPMFAAVPCAATRAASAEMLKIGPDGRGAADGTCRRPCRRGCRCRHGLPGRASARFRVPEQTMDGAVADRIDIARCLHSRSSRESPRRLICQDGVMVSLPEMKWRLIEQAYPGELFTSTSRCAGVKLTPVHGGAVCHGPIRRRAAWVPSTSMAAMSAARRSRSVSRRA